ncbi:hypothetical protein SAMN05660649_00758 [Desulfotomaculum arcticum]|uniref:Response regulatory domain-containing protein n=1 Tax=Desulfotruncus arcticus DSM 17038 TaxID=1121424 RepID=A0A1I2PEQ6_9FIRM|nr:hypothetical protein SAMN05660649_00758 [Desulfotomaculum arcticum] [Desulfotruncus arcticus DSM 17038]
MNSARILIIEDDVEINQLVAKYLNKEGFDADSVYGKRSTLVYFQSGIPTHHFRLDVA